MLIFPFAETRHVPAQVPQATHANPAVAREEAAPSAPSVANALLTDTQGRLLNHHVSLGPAYRAQLESMDSVQVAHSEEVYKTAIMQRKEKQSRSVQFFSEVRNPVDDDFTMLNNRP